MDLARALGLGDTELVSFVGAGGKKTAMRQLLEEAGDRRVGYTTTTHTPPPDDLPLVVDSDPTASLASVEPQVAFAAGRVNDPKRAEEKLRGFGPETVTDLFARDLFDWLLVKADGARRREFKAPGPDEPVVPAASTIVVPVAAVDAVGKPLAAPVVHRPKHVASLVDLAVEESITPTAVGKVLASPDGGCKHVPPGASVTPIVNKADTDAKRRLARQAVNAALESPRIDRGVVTSFETGTLDLIE